MADLAKIESCPGFAKDMTTGAVLNTDMVALQAYKHRKRLMNNARADHERITTLEDRLTRIESLLMKLVGNE